MFYQMFRNTNLKPSTILAMFYFKKNWTEYIENTF